MSKKPKQYDCSGYVTKYNVLCSDRRVLLQECFAHQDGVKVPRSEERRVGKECRSRWSPYH